MKKYFEQLRPGERRLAVGVIVAVIVVLNYMFIWPHYGDWGRADGQIQQLKQQLRMYQDTIAQEGTYQLMLKKFESQGEYVAPENQSIDLMRAVSMQSAATGVGILNAAHSTTQTNDDFFVEQVQNINVTATDEQLVNFLYNLGNDPSMIRVHDLELQPDGPRQRLNATIQLVASYQKTQGLKNATATAK
jgi:Tfp pilus assembly protein PilO